MSGLFGAGGPVLGLPDQFDEPEFDDRVVGAAEPESLPPADGATSVNHQGTLSVTATATGQPVDVRIDPREMRYGGSELAAAILDLCQKSAQEAKVRRRDELAAAGVGHDILDKLGLPTRDELSADQSRRDADEPAPATWMRQV